MALFSRPRREAQPAADIVADARTIGPNDLREICGTQERDRLYRTFISWRSMLERCLFDGVPNSKNYAGRGITVDLRWLEFPVFVEDMGLRPDGLSLDRIDNDRGYTAKNCRWATPKQQGRNTRRNRIVQTIHGPMLMVDAARIAGVSSSTITRRIRAGVPVADLLSRVPLLKTRLSKSQVLEIRKRIDAGDPPKAIAERFGVCHQTVSDIKRKKSWARVD